MVAAWLLVPMGLAVLALIGWWARRDMKTVGPPSCGQCQYPVYGLPTFTCPECGSDLREVGIKVPPRRRASQRRLGVVTATVVVVGIIMLFALRLARISAAVQAKTATIQQQVRSARVRSVQSIAPGGLNVRVAPPRADNDQTNSSTFDESP